MRSLKTLMVKDQPERPRQHWQQQLQIMEAWAAHQNKKEIADGR